MHITRRNPTIYILFFLFFVTSQPLLAQGAESSSNVYIIAVLIIIGALILVSAILTLSENLIQIEAKQSGLDSSRHQLSIIPTFKSLWKSAPATYTAGQNVVELTRGFEIKLNGSPEEKEIKNTVSRFALRPRNFRGLAPIPKVVVNEGDEVKAGDVLFHDKKDDTIKFVSPVSGEVVEIRRGEKRSITEVVVLADKKPRYKEFEPPSIQEASREEIVSFMCESGGWTLLNQRPHDVIPEPESIPNNIFISTFDTAPLAPDLNYLIEGREKFFQIGLQVLGRLTGGEVHLGLNAGGAEAPHQAFVEAEGVVKHWFKGDHPSGNVGIQIHHIDPIRPGGKVWTLDVQQAITLGELFHTGRYNPEKWVAISGSEVGDTGYVKTFQGANVGELLSKLSVNTGARFIAGDVLSGRQVSADDFIDFRCDQITLITEGDYYEIFGWLLPLNPRPSISRTFPNFMFSDLSFDGDTNTHGEKRAFVVTGQYEKVLPMKIYPQHLMKAIMMGDFEEMEGLGINELTEEDIALCEFVCTSKMPLQQILREGLDMLRDQS